MSVDNFLDSNILVYLFDDVDSYKQQKAESLLQSAIEHGDACISFQVVQETINVITKKLGASAEDMHKLLDGVLVHLWKVNPSYDLYHASLNIQARYKYSFYDSLIVAAAMEAGCKTLYSEDLQHGQQIENMMICNPFIR